MLSAKLTTTPAAALAILKAADAGQQVALALEVPLHQLLNILYERPFDGNYTVFQIPKKRGGYRTICAPRGTLAILQEKVLSILAPHYAPPSWVHGFAPKRSVYTNAVQHVKRALVLNLDIEDFYDSINFGRVRGVLQTAPWKFGPKVATMLARIVTYRNRLPQGACTSPLFANVVAWALDRKMLQLAKAHHLTYTRYADDITFSTTKKSLPNELVSWEGANPISSTVALGPQLERAVERAGFRVNRAKLRVQPPCIRQEVTGLTVNQFPNVERRFVRKVRALLHSWRKNGLIAAEQHHLTKHVNKPPSGSIDAQNGTYFRHVVYGHLAYLKQVRGVNDRIYLKFCADVALLDTHPPRFILEAKDQLDMHDFFICHASEDKDAVVRPLAGGLRAVGLKVFVDEDYIKLGDSFVKKINAALGRTKHVVAVISQSSYKKHWPTSELSSVLAMEASKGTKLLPIMVGDDSDVRLFLRELPLLSDRVHFHWKPQVAQAVNVSNAVAKLRALL